MSLAYFGYLHIQVPVLFFLRLDDLGAAGLGCVLVATLAAEAITDGELQFEFALVFSWCGNSFMQTILIVLREVAVRVGITGLEIVSTLSNLVNFMLVLESQSVTEL